MSPIAVLITVAAYFVVLFTVAYFAGRKADNQGFFVGNRKSPWFIVALAMIGSSISGVTFISVPGWVEVNNFSYLQMVLGFVVGQFIIAFVLIPLFYRMQLVSIYEYLQQRFGISSYKTGAWFFFISKMLGAAVRIFLVCIVMQFLVFDPLGVDFIWNVALTMLIVWLYTFQGGVKSLIWTDTLKTFCLIVSVGLCIYYIASDLNLGFGSMFRAVADSDLSRTFFFDDVNDKRYFFKQFLAGVFTVIAMNGLDQDMMQRNLSCATPRDSQKNIVLTAVSQIFVIFLFLVLGVLLYLYMECSGLTPPAKSDQVFSLVAVDGGLPLVVGILFVVGLISSTYSAAGSALTALTTSFTVDILEGTKRCGEERLTRLRKGVHILMALGMAAVILAFEYWADDSVINLVYKVAGYTYGPILGMFAFGMFTRRKVRDRWIPLVAVAAPVLSALVQWWAREAWGYRIGFELLIYNAAFTMIGMSLLVERDEK